MINESVAGCSDKIRIYKDNHVMDVFVVDAREIVELHGYTYEKPGEVMVKKGKKKEAEIIVEEGE